MSPSCLSKSDSAASTLHIPARGKPPFSKNQSIVVSKVKIPIIFLSYGDPMVFATADAWKLGTKK